VSDLRPSLDAAFAAFALDATVTPPGEDAIETSGFWVSPLTDDVPGPLEFSRREARRVFVLKRADVPTLPLKTVIEAPLEAGGVVQRWMVDGFDRIEQPDELRPIVIAAPEAET
jgi:hypothetical protein